MGLGAYLAAITDTKHYEVEFARETRQIQNSADLEDKEMYRLFAEYGLGREVVGPLARQLKGDPDAWVKVCLYSKIWIFVTWVIADWQSL